MKDVEKSRGQALVLFALMLIALLGMAALAIDISAAYAELRHERAAADSAALAGASDNYRVGSTTVDNTEWTRARTHAMQNLIDELDPNYVAGGALPTCAGQSAPYANNVVNCQLPGTRYYVSILAPAPSCTPGACDPARSVQVTVRSPRHGLTFARLFGQAQWNLPVTSVAERDRGTNYSFVTLRPPKPRSHGGTDQNEDDVSLAGVNTELVVRGDMGTNTNMVLTNGATVTLLDSGSFVDRYDTYKAWVGPPPDNQIPQPIPDPNYPIPVAPTDAALIYADAAGAHMTAALCKAEVAKVNVNYSSLPVPVDDAGVDAGTVVCLKPGRYDYAPGGPSYSAVRTMIFSPGVYFFYEGLKPGNNNQLVGGYEAGMPGVAFVFKDRCAGGGGCEFAGNTVDILALNAGAAYPSGTGTAATAAVNWDSTLVETTGPVPLPMTLVVEKNPACFVAIIDPCDVSVSQYRQLNLPGSGSMFVFGVQYAATDNVFITGGSGSNGYLGQMWSWTVTYTGGSIINLIGANNTEPGVLRIATPCSPGAPCTNPEAAAPIP